MVNFLKEKFQETKKICEFIFSEVLYAWHSMTLTRVKFFLKKLKFYLPLNICLLKRKWEEKNATVIA